MHLISERTFRNRICTGLLVIAALLPLSACSVFAKERDPFDLALTTFTLRNGMKVVLHEDRRAPKVKVTYRVGVGSADEPAGRAGFAHLFEHLMFMGTKAAPNFDKVMERVGGENNAYTDFDETVYYETSPSNALPTLLWLEADRLANLPAYMTEEKVNKQREVVLNEMRQNVLDEPGGSAAEASGVGLFVKSHPYYRPVIGSIADLQAAKAADVVDFFSKYYAPSNITMVVAGDFDTKRTTTMIRNLFDQIKPRVTPKRKARITSLCKSLHNTSAGTKTANTKSARTKTSPATATKTGTELTKTTAAPEVRNSEGCVARTAKRQTFVDAVANPQLSIGWAAPPNRFGGSISDPNLELASAMMNNVYANSMHKSLVRERKLATSLSVSYDGKEHAGFFDISAEAAPGISLATLEVELRKELRTLITKGFTESELATAKTSEATGFAEQFEDAYGRADLLQTALTRYGSPHQIKGLRTRFNNVTLQSARQALQSMIETSPELTQEVLPGDRGDFPPILQESSGKPTPPKTFRVAPTDIARPRDTEKKNVTVPNPETYRLDNGVVLHYFERSDAPRMRLLMRINGGTVRDPKTKLGRANFLAYTIMRGVGKRDGEQLTRDLAKNGASISVDADDGLYRVGLNVTPSNTKAGLDILADVLQRPTFAEKELSLSKAEIVSYFEAAQADPDENASRAGVEFFDPKDHRHQYGTLATYKSFTRKDLVDEHRATFQPQNTEMISAGPLPGREFVKLLNASMKGWKNDGPPAAKYTEMVPPASPIRTVLVDVPDAAQSTVVFTATGPSSNTPNSIAASVASQVLGGTFSSRLNTSLREEKGYTYGIGGTLTRGKTYGTFETVTSVETSVTGKALEEILRVIDDFQTGNMDQREADVATSGAYAGSVELVSTSSALVGTYDVRLDAGRPWVNVGKDLTKAGTMSVRELNEGAKIILDGRSKLIVIAGDLAKVKPQLKGLQIGKITEVTPTF